MDSNNLLSFVNSASCDIKQAIDKAPKRRRNVTVKKYAENRVKDVKRLDTKKPRSNPLTTKRQPSSQLKLPSRLPGSSLLQHANTWPVIATTASPVQSVGLPTTNISVQQSSSMYTGSDSNICLSMSRAPSSRIDPELESLLSELECPSVPISRHGSFDSVCTAPSCTPPLSTLDPVYMAEQQVFSPYSDYSDELDSAYCSPNGSAPSSAQVSYSCSPTNLTSSMPDWCPTDLLPPMNANCLQEVGMISSRCNWVSQDSSPLTITTSTTTSSVSSPFDQGPPMTPTVSELLQQYNQY